MNAEAVNDDCCQIADDVSVSTLKIGIQSK